MKIKFVLFSVTCILFVVSDLFAQSSYSVKTKTGELVVEQNENFLTQIKIGKHVLLGSQIGAVTVEGKFPQTNPILIVVSISENGEACAAEFRVIDVSKNEPTITDTFGNCNPAPRIVFQNQILTIKFADGHSNKGAYKYGRAQSWQYVHGNLRKLK